MNAAIAHSRHIALALAVAFATLVTARGQRGHAQPERAIHTSEALHWHSPDGCASEAEFMRALDEHLAASQIERRSASEIAVNISREGRERWRARIEVTTGPGLVREREFSDRSCAAVVDAAALVVALAYEEAAQTPLTWVTVAHTAPPTPAMAVVPPPTPTPDATITRRDPPARGPRLGLGIRVTGGADVGRLPGVATGLSLAMFGQRGRWRVELSGLYMAGSDADVPGDRFGRAELSLWTAGTRACGHMRFLWLCAGAAVERWAGQGVNLISVSSGTATVASLSSALAWRRKIFNLLHLWIELEAALPVAVPQFALQNGTVVHQRRRISGHFAAGIEIQIR